MAINAEVEKNNQESTANLIRRFTKRVQGAGIIPKMRQNRYYKRARSPYVVKTERLRKLERKKKYDQMLKLGKVQETRGRR